MLTAEIRLSTLYTPGFVSAHFEDVEGVEDVGNIERQQ